MGGSFLLLGCWVKPAPFFRLALKDLNLKMSLAWVKPGESSARFAVFSFPSLPGRGVKPEPFFRFALQDLTP